MNPNINIDTVIESTFIGLANHTLIRQPIVRNKVGAAIKITRFRDDDGFDENQNGLTLSIYPYSYKGTSNESVQTGNAALVYESYHVGSGTPAPSFDRCRMHLVVKLQALNYNRVTETETYNGFTIEFVRNETERALRKWMEQLRTILLTNPMNSVSGLVKNSHVNHIIFKTTDWLGQDGKNAVLHEASMIWQLELNSPRNWKTWPLYNPLDGVDSWKYIGVELRTAKPVYYDYASQQIVTVDGFILTTTPPPANIPVKYNPTALRFERMDGTPLTSAELIDPATGKTWIATYLKIVGVKKTASGQIFDGLKQNLYWNTITTRLELADGTPVTALEGPDGILGNADDIAISYNPTTQVLSVTYPGQSSRPVNVNTDPVYTFNSGKVSIYDANGITLRESFNI